MTLDPLLHRCFIGILSEIFYPPGSSFLLTPLFPVSLVYSVISRGRHPRPSLLAQEMPCARPTFPWQITRSIVDDPRLSSTPPRGRHILLFSHSENDTSSSFTARDHGHEPQSSLHTTTYQTTQNTSGAARIHTYNPFTYTCHATKPRL